MRQAAYGESVNHRQRLTGNRQLTTTALAVMPWIFPAIIETAIWYSTSRHSRLDNELFSAEPIKPTYKGAAIMSKGKDSKKQEKKKPQKTLMEKRAEKRAKRENKTFSLVVK